MSKQFMNMRQLLVACRTFADDNDGKFPKELQSLYPEYMDVDFLLKFLNPENRKLEPYIYFTGLIDTDYGKSPLISSPQIGAGIRIVGFVNGEVARLTEEEYASLEKSLEKNSLNRKAEKKLQKSRPKVL